MIDYFNELGLIGLFLASFLASTVVPISSELVLFFLLYKGVSPMQCLVVATIGNALGGAITYYLGYISNIDLINKYMGISATKIKKWELFVKRTGKYIALLSWVPFVGDVFMLLLGLLKSPTTITLIFMFIGKLIRYVVLIYCTNLILKS